MYLAVGILLMVFGVGIILSAGKMKAKRNVAVFVRIVGMILFAAGAVALLLLLTGKITLPLF